MFARISKYFRKISDIDLNPLVLDDKAMDRLEVERKKQNKNLHLEIRIIRDREKKGTVHVGFSLDSLNHPVHPTFGQIVTEEDFESLASGLISYDDAEGRYLFYPNIDLLWEDTPKVSIKRIRANKHFTKKDQEWTSDAGSICPPIKSIIEHLNVISCYAKGSLFQIEVKDHQISNEFEEEISEYLLIYFSSLYPPLA